MFIWFEIYNMSVRQLLDGVIQEERSVFWEMIVSIFVKKFM
jgi:hypothetical protein